MDPNLDRILRILSDRAEAISTPPSKGGDRTPLWIALIGFTVEYQRRAWGPRSVLKKYWSDLVKEGKRAGIFTELHVSDEERNHLKELIK